MKKIVTIFAGLVVSLSIIAETNTNNNIIYIKNETIRTVDNGTDLYAAKSNTSIKEKTSNSGSSKNSQSGVASYYGKGLQKDTIEMKW